MAKKKRKKTERKRDLKYGSAVSRTLIKDSKVAVDSNADKEVVPLENSGFRKELKRNLIFVFSFFVLLVVIFLILTRTNLLEPLLQAIGMGGLYHQ